MHTEQTVEELNKGISYAAGKVFWGFPGSSGAGWTSQLWFDLCKQGVRTSNNHGMITVYFHDGKEAGPFLGRVNMLVGVAKLLA